MSKARCDVCGRWIARKYIACGWARCAMVTPDSDYSTEELETLCIKHTIERRERIKRHRAAKQRAIMKEKLKPLLD